MILTDGNHLVSTVSFAELHAFAEKIGLRYSWFQDHRISHYDLFGWSMVDRVCEAGAVFVTSRELVRRAFRRNLSTKITRPRPITWTDRPQLQADIAGEGE